MHEIFQECIEHYFNTDVRPKLDDRRTGEELLINLVDIWDNFIIFAKMMDRMFDYLNRYYLNNENLPLLGEQCMTMLDERVFM